MSGVTHIRLVDGPLVDTKTWRTLLVERMANDLIRAPGTANSEVAAMRTLRICGHAMADIVMLIDDARQVAMQDIVAEEMAKS
jgi:hypothetical protein